MLIRCPKCRTTYKVSDDLLKGPAPTFRCSRCKHTFDLDISEAPESPNATAPGHESVAATLSNNQELTLPFAPKPLSEPEKKDAPTPSDSAPTKTTTDEAKANGVESWSISDHKREEEQPFTMPAMTRPMELEKVMEPEKDFPAKTAALPSARGADESENIHNILPIATYLEQRVSIFPFLTLFGILVIGFSLAAVITYAHPKASENIVRKIPLVGPSVLKNNHLKEGILVQSLRSGYQTIQGNREVFLISGVAFNQNPVVIREIQLSGKIFNQDGKELENQTIWAGNTMSQKILRGMTLEDIPHLQSLKPLKTFEVPPGDSVPFTIVFLKPTKYIKDFSCEVVMAEGEA